MVKFAKGQLFFNKSTLYKDQCTQNQHYCQHLSVKLGEHNSSKLGFLYFAHILRALSQLHCPFQRLVPTTRAFTQKFNLVKLCVS